MSTLVFGKDVIVKNKGTDRYERTLGRVCCGGMDVNFQMVCAGFAWRYVQYSKEPSAHRSRAEGAGGKAGLVG